MVKQEGVVNIVDWFADALSLGPEGKVLCLTTFCFDISVLEMFMPLFRGSTLVLAKASSQKDPFQLLELVDNAGVTVVQATPTTYEMMLATGWTGDGSIDFLVGGEAFRPSLLPLTHNCKSFRNVCKFLSNRLAIVKCSQMPWSFYESRCNRACWS
jgi:non-ribosomal peptide synthetase component F